MIETVIHLKFFLIEDDFQNKFEYSELDKLVSDTAISLVKEGKARWQYLNEGRHNMAVLFVVTDHNIDEKYMKGTEMIENKVFRILKNYKSNPLFSSANDQIEYLNSFSKYGN